jgi:KDO2-lipid IV(A) lauroyltransferase
MADYSQMRQAAAAFWLRRFFRLAEHAPRFTVAARPFFCGIAWIFSPSIRHGTQANAARVLGAKSTPAQQRRLAWKMLGSFYLFCCDVGQCSRAAPEELLARVEWVGGHETYLAARAARRGLIIVTAHMGSFEVALAALREHEPHVHVLFRRDAVDEFDAQRAELRRRLGVHEVAVDDGWTVWISLRQALLDDQVVVIQGDRVLPGQKGRFVPFLGGEMELPLSPIKLALASGAPILPVFSVRTPSGKIRLSVENPIEVKAEHIDSAFLHLAGLIEKQIQLHPDQWLILRPAWRQDQTNV